MFERLGRRLHPGLGRRGMGDAPTTTGGSSVALVPGATESTDRDSTLSVPDAPDTAGAMVEFVAYGADAMLMGHLRMASERLTDVLNENDELELVDVVVESLADGQTTPVRALRIPRHDLLLVQATGPRGDLSRRRRTRPYPVAVKVGPYRVRGHLHAALGVDPEVMIYRRDPMVPLTDAWVERPLGEERDLYPIGTVVLNRDHMEWVMATWDDSSDWLEVDRPTMGGPSTAA